MEIPRLRIEQQMAKIGIKVQHAQLHMDMPDMSMEINWKPPKMTVNRESAGIALNMDEVKANLGLKNNDQLKDDVVTKAYQAAKEGTQKIVKTAAYVGDVTIHGQNKIGAAARNKMLEYIDTDMGHSSVPPGIEMDGYPGSLAIDWAKGEISIDFKGGGMANGYVDPPCSVEVYLKQRPNVRISLAEGSILPTTGRRVSLQA